MSRPLANGAARGPAPAPSGPGIPVGHLWTGPRPEGQPWRPLLSRPEWAGFSPYRLSPFDRQWIVYQDEEDGSWTGPYSIWCSR